LSAETYVGDAGQLGDLIFIGNVGHTTSGNAFAGPEDKILGIDGSVHPDSLEFRQHHLDGDFGVIKDFTAYSGHIWSLTKNVVYDGVAFTYVRVLSRHGNDAEDAVFDEVLFKLYREGGAEG